jgi:hypothetical protein
MLKRQYDGVELQRPWSWRDNAKNRRSEARITLLCMTSHIAILLPDNDYCRRVSVGSVGKAPRYQSAVGQRTHAHTHTYKKSMLVAARLGVWTNINHKVELSCSEKVAGRQTNTVLSRIKRYVQSIYTSVCSISHKGTLAFRRWKSFYKLYQWNT